MTESEGPSLIISLGSALTIILQVNKMEYRVECQVLSALHAENRIALRFPIGLSLLSRERHYCFYDDEHDDDDEHEHDDEHGIMMIPYNTMR
jgi:hypothetical protein